MMTRRHGWHCSRIDRISHARRAANGRMDSKDRPEKKTCFPVLMRELRYNNKAMASQGGDKSRRQAYQQSGLMYVTRKCLAIELKSAQTAFRLRFLRRKLQKRVFSFFVLLLYLCPPTYVKEALCIEAGAVCFCLITSAGTNHGHPPSQSNPRTNPSSRRHRCRRIHIRFSTLCFLYTFKAETLKSSIIVSTTKLNELKY